MLISNLFRTVNKLLFFIFMVSFVHMGDFKISRSQHKIITVMPTIFQTLQAFNTHTHTATHKYSIIIYHNLTVVPQNHTHLLYCHIQSALFLIIYLFRPHPHPPFYSILISAQKNKNNDAATKVFVQS